MTPQTSTPTPTGRRETREGFDSVVLDRTFHAGIDDVWAAITESDRLERWIGTWSGDPASGSVQFAMNAEGEGHSDETFTIDDCERPHRLVLTSTTHDDPPQVWHFTLTLAEADGVTTLTFSQSVPHGAMAGGVGPGWEYYLDRLVAAETGADVAAIDFDDYYPGQQDHYVAMFT